MVVSLYVVLGVLIGFLLTDIASVCTTVWRAHVNLQGGSMTTRFEQRELSPPLNAWTTRRSLLLVNESGSENATVIEAVSLATANRLSLPAAVPRHGGLIYLKRWRWDNASKQPTPRREDIDPRFPQLFPLEKEPLEKLWINDSESYVAPHRHRDRNRSDSANAQSIAYRFRSCWPVEEDLAKAKCGIVITGWNVHHRIDLYEKDQYRLRTSNCTTANNGCGRFSFTTIVQRWDMYNYNLNRTLHPRMPHIPPRAWIDEAFEAVRNLRREQKAFGNFPIVIFTDYPVEARVLNEIFFKPAKKQQRGARPLGVGYLKSNNFHIRVIPRLRDKLDQNNVFPFDVTDEVSSLFERVLFVHPTARPSPVIPKFIAPMSFFFPILDYFDALVVPLPIWELTSVQLQMSAALANDARSRSIRRWWQDRRTFFEHWDGNKSVAIQAPPIVVQAHSANILFLRLDGGKNSLGYGFLKEWERVHHSTNCATAFGVGRLQRSVKTHVEVINTLAVHTPEVCSLNTALMYHAVRSRAIAPHTCFDERFVDRCRSKDRDWLFVARCWSSAPYYTAPTSK